MNHDRDRSASRRALDAVCLALFAYLALVTTGVALAASAPWRPSPYLLGALTSLMVAIGAWTFPRLAVRVAGETSRPAR